MSSPVHIPSNTYVHTSLQESTKKRGALILVAAAISLVATGILLTASTLGLAGGIGFCMTGVGIPLGILVIAISTGILCAAGAAGYGTFYLSKKGISKLME
jgi:predicted PurR-regulated permease PerM